jgi:integrase/recombinase XerD
MTAFIPATSISPLRQRLIDDMNMRRFSPETQRNYIRDVGASQRFWDARPIRRRRRICAASRSSSAMLGVPTPTMNSIVSALRFFFTHTLDRPDLARKLVRVNAPRKLPVVLSRDEVARLLERDDLPQASGGAVGRLWRRPARGRGGGLKVSDIDSERMLLRVERGKGGRYRNAMLPADLLTCCASGGRSDGNKA